MRVTEDLQKILTQNSGHTLNKMIIYASYDGKIFDQQKYCLSPMSFSILKPLCMIRSPRGIIGLRTVGLFGLWFHFEIQKKQLRILRFLGFLFVFIGRASKIRERIFELWIPVFTVNVQETYTRINKR